MYYWTIEEERLKAAPFFDITEYGSTTFKMANVKGALHQLRKQVINFLKQRRLNKLVRHWTKERFC